MPSHWRGHLLTHFCSFPFLFGVLQQTLSMTTYKLQELYMATALYGFQPCWRILLIISTPGIETRTNEAITQVLGFMFVALLIIAWTAGNWNAWGVEREKKNLLFLQDMNKGERFLNWAQQRNQHLPILRSLPQPSERILFQSPKWGPAGASQILAASSQDSVSTVKSSRNWGYQLGQSGWNEAKKLGNRANPAGWGGTATPQDSVHQNCQGTLGRFPRTTMEKGDKTSWNRLAQQSWSQKSHNSRRFGLEGP